MQFDYLFTMDNPGNVHPYRTLLDMAMEQVLAVEEAGFGTIWQGEHHFGGEGFEINPNPLMAGAWIASVTSRIRIGTGAVTPVFWHPLRLAEDIALLDQMSGGRLDCGVARGIQPREATNFNLDGDRRDEQRNWRFFLEIIDILKRAWTEEAFTYEGEFYRFPHPGVKDSATWHPRNPLWRSEDGEYIAMSIIPKPLQKPYPPMWNLLDKTPGFVVAAEQGFNVITWLRSREGLREVMTTYRDALTESTGTPAQAGDGFSLMRCVYVAETMEQARAEAEPLIEQLYSYVGGVRSRELFANPGEKLTDEEQTGPWYDFLFDREHLFIGTPESVTEQIRHLRDEYGMRRLVTWMWLPGLTQEQVMRSLELFANEVMPNLQGDGPPTILPALPEGGLAPLTGD
ncbi:MAG: LLM class flavin-dependent oxidoreductase [Solirubrobacteraceae bacterium]